MAARLEPTLRRRRVVGETEAVESRRLGGRRDLGDALARDELRVVWVADDRVRDRVAHLSSVVGDGYVISLRW